MKLRQLSFLSWLICFATATNAQVKPGDIFPDWSADYMDIHHISTGRGECVFAILPDGTTMMIDAGETGTDKRNFKPDGSRSTGEWISRYMLRMMRPLPEKKLDYIMLTHFHDDHMGNVKLSNRKSKKGDYILTGVTEVGTLIPFGKIIDRNWPDYNYPRSMTDDQDMQNYIRFVNWHVANGAKAEQFQVGSNQQFKLVRQAGKFPGFEIRNIAANGQVWTGTHNNTRHHFPPLDKLPEDDYPEENACSAAIRISYGKFDYFNGGDLIRTHTPGTWKHIEMPVGLAAGPVDVCEANHHAKDAMSAEFVRAVAPRVFVIQGFALSHPDAIALKAMLAKNIYPGERDIFTSHLFDVNKTVLGSTLVRQLKSTQGHTVIRVHPGGDSYEVYVLDDTSENFIIKSIHGKYESR
ncbi:ComEC/Rec2 family competence protein [Dyadobacter sp. CY323]|uniref:ComEC/Rec2 family competence protein n=1 Tax=Dyadobacter sp. CY323 TaxID=2907302 RepID=UPI001F43043B|nr:MBL fold metallo-hydrolase [Dyadobacter sp. CY323]MCE6989857.1 MBL fold metallo-hydrolase [Dyadobacter sp. CY323]